MEASLLILTNFVIIIIVGILISLLSNKLKMSNVLLLLLAGLVLGYVANLTGFISFSMEGMITLAVLALALIVFYGSSKFKFQSLDEFSVAALKLTGAFLFFNLLFFSFFISWLFFGEWSLVSVLYACVFAIIMVGTDPASVFSLMKSKKSEIIDLLEVEAILNTPVMVILPFIILDIILNSGNLVVLNWQDYTTQIFQQVLVGIGAGVFVGIIFFKAMKHFYSEDLSPLAIITSAVLAYVLAENLGGNGVLSVAVLGFFFGSISLANKSSLQAFSGIVSNGLEILVFVLIGFIVKVDLSLTFILKSLFVFIVLLLARYLAVRVSLRRREYTKKEQWFIILNMPKGIAVAVLVFSLSVFGISQLETLNSLMVLMMIYSIILSSIVTNFADHFIRVKVIKEKV